MGGVSIMCLGMAMLISILSSEAMGQVLAQGGALKPPKSEETQGSPKYVVYLIAVLLTGGVVFAATLKSKRSHQD
jgi:hypothetical protein